MGATNQSSARENVGTRAPHRCSWITATSLLLIMSSSQTSAFTPLAPTRSLSLAGSSNLPTLQTTLQIHSPTRLQVASVEPPAADAVDLESLRGDDGIYNIVTGDQHKAFLQEHSDKLVIMKVFAPWCRACKGLEPKFLQISKGKELEDKPIVFCSMTIQDNKAYVKSIGVLALPSVQFYKNGQLVDNFPCGPSKVPILKRKLSDLIERSVDPVTGLVKSVNAPKGDALEAEHPAGTDAVAPTDDATAAQQAATDSGHDYLTNEQIQYMRTSIPFFEAIPDSDFDVALQAAKMLTFESSSVIMREGNPGNTFYVILEGEVEICQRTAFEDPLIAPSDYIGTVINRLGTLDWFGERALITGEPRAASIRVTDNLRCVAFNKDALPATCVLSGKPTATNEIKERINEKYGLRMKELDELENRKQINDSYMVNQKRGSLNSPQVIQGVDTDDDDVPLGVWEEPEDETYLLLKTKSESVVPLLEKFKLIRLISRCVDYIVKNGAEWGNPAIRRRRSLLASRLPKSQREEFVEAFHLVDRNNDGGINLNELRGVMETIGEQKSETVLNEIIPHGDIQGADGEDVMTLQDFVGIMSEVEFYYLFRDVFASLDKRDVGFVKAAELDRVLCGVRDLISDDRHSIIDVEDKDMMIDYERFTKMLLGITL